MTGQTTNIDAIKAKQKATWCAGDYGVVAKRLEASAIEFLDRIGVEPGSRVLDVACGTGQLAIPAARAGAQAAGIDIVEVVIDDNAYYDGEVFVRFDPLGASSFHTVTLHQELFDRTFTIEAMPLTGDIRFHDGIFKREPAQEGDFD